MLLRRPSWRAWQCEAGEGGGERGVSQAATTKAVEGRAGREERREERGVHWCRDDARRQGKTGMCPLPRLVLPAPSCPIWAGPLALRRAAQCTDAQRGHGTHSRHVARCVCVCMADGRGGGVRLREGAVEEQAPANKSGPRAAADSTKTSLAGRSGATEDQIPGSRQRIATAVQKLQTSSYTAYLSLTTTTTE